MENIEAYAIVFAVVAVLEFIALVYLIRQSINKFDRDTELRRYDRWWANEYDDVPTDLRDQWY